MWIDRCPVRIGLQAQLPDAAHAIPLSSPDPTFSPQDATMNPKFRRNKPFTQYAWMTALLIAMSAFVFTAQAQAQDWLPAANRYSGVYDNQLIGNYGIQFQRVITWNEGRADAGKRGWIVTGQDENGVRVSRDYGATWTHPRLSGLFCSKIAGLYLNSDDDLFVALGGQFSSQDFVTISVDGIYVGDSSLTRAKRVEITRPSGPGPDAPGGKRAFTEVSYAGNSVIRSSNFVARRPQTGGLSDADRPIWALEQILTDGSISYIALYKSTDAGASFQFVQELPVSQYASGNDGIYHILAAPNGDVAILGKRGLWVSRDMGATFTRKFPSSGSVEISAGYFFGGGATAPSGMRIGVYAANADGGVWETSDIRSVAFAKPNGNNGLPANYRVWHLGGSPANPDRLAVCTDLQPGLPPFLSSDGGRNFTVIEEITGSGDEAWRYNVRRGHAGFHFCPTDEFKCLIPTFQTMARSLDGAERSDGDLVSGFDGMHTKGNGFDAWGGDWRKMLRVCQDSFVNTSYGGMHWVASAGLGTGSPAFKDALGAAGAGTTGYVSGAGGVICPNNRVIAGANRNSGGQSNVMVILDLNPDGTVASYTLESSQLKSRATHSRRSPKNPDVAFVGRWAISNLGAPNPADIVFTDHNSHEIFDCLMDGGTLVSYWANVRSGGTRSGTEIYRSTHDTGANNQTVPWYILPTSSFVERAICADYFNPERVLYVRNDDRNVIREIRRVGADLVDSPLRNSSGQPVNLRTMAGGMLDILTTEIGSAVTVPPVATAITQLIADPNQPGVFYAIAGLHGMPNWWRTVDNGVTWTNISGDAPRTLWTGVVHPMTGEVMGFSSMGEHIHRSPDVYPDLPDRDALTRQMKEYFADVPKAPVLSAVGRLAAGTEAIQPALPTGIEAGDILLLIAETANEVIHIADANGGSWTPVAGTPQGTGSPGAPDATRLTAFWSRYNGTQGAPMLSDSGDHQMARILSFRGAVASGDPFDSAASGVEATAGTSANIPGATTRAANTLLVLAATGSLPNANGTANFSAWSNEDLVALKERSDESSDAGNGGSLGIATGILAEAGACENTRVTLAVSGSRSLLSLAIKPASGSNSAPLITTTALPNGVLGQAYSSRLAASGGDGALVWSLASGSLPAGLSLSGEGIISGTPTVYGGPIVFTVRVSDVDGSTGASDEDTQTLGMTIDPGVNGVFASSQDVGSPVRAGSVSYNSSTGGYTISGGGADITGMSDQFHFVHQSWEGDGRIVARVTSVQNTHPSAKAGLMFRGGTAANAVNVNIALSASGGTQLSHREQTGGETMEDAHVSGVSAPYWLRLERVGDRFTAWQSPDGLLWFQSGSTLFAMADSAEVGLAVTSHDNAQLNASTFESVSVTKPPDWFSADIGYIGSTGNTVHDRGTDVITLNSSGADIGGYADAFQFHYLEARGDTTIVAEISAVENSHPDAKGGVMIRANLSSGSSHAYLGILAGGGIEFRFRKAEGGGTSQEVDAAVAAPRFVKLVRAGSTFRAYHSPDGGIWTQLGQPATIPMNEAACVGLAGCSIVNSPFLFKSAFESVYVK